MSTDKNLFSIHAQQVFTRVLPDLIPPDDSYSDTLKFSGGSYDGHVFASRLVGGREDVVDMNGGIHDVRVTASMFEPRGKFVATIKGGCKRCALSGLVRGHGTEVDVDLGNWSDQSSEVTEDIELELVSHDGSPIRVRYLLAEKPVLRNGHIQKYVFVFPSQLPLWMKRLGFKIWGFFKKRSLTS